jgi:hypothetical protein
MATEKFRVEIVDGPGELDVFLRSLLDGKRVQFTLDFKGGQRRMNATIGGAHHISGRVIWELEGWCENPSDQWVQFSRAVYDVKTRRGYFVFPLQDENTEEHPICGHRVPKDIRRCPICGADRMDVG